MKAIDGKNTVGGEMAQAQGVNAALYQRFMMYLDAKPRTVEAYGKNLRAFFRWLVKHGVNAPRFEDVKRYRDELLSLYKPSTVTAYIFAVRRFFEWTESEGLYPNIAGRIKGATLSRDFKKDYLTSSQLKDVISRVSADDLRGQRDKAMISLMAACGLRDIEVSRANVEDLRTAGDNTVLYLQGKGRDERAEFVIVPAAVERVIREYIKERGEVGKAEPLFVSMSNNSKGERMTTRSISGIVKAAMRAAGFDSERLTAHSLRHTAVTLALLGGATVQEAQQFARHRNIATTQIYAHNLDAMKNPCSGLVADSIF